MEELERVDNLCEWLKATELKNEELHVEYDSVDEVVDKGKKCSIVKLLTSK